MNTKKTKVKKAVKTPVKKKVNKAKKASVNTGTTCPNNASCNPITRHWYNPLTWF